MVAQPVKTRLESRISNFKGGWAWTCHQPYGSVTQRRPKDVDLSMPGLEKQLWTCTTMRHRNLIRWKFWPLNKKKQSSTSEAPPANQLLQTEAALGLAFICHPGCSPPRRFWTKLKTAHMTKLIHKSTSISLLRWCFCLGLDGRRLIMPINLGPDNPFEASDNSNWRALSN